MILHLFDIKLSEFKGVKCATQSHDIWLQYDLDFIVTVFRIAVMSVVGHECLYRSKLNCRMFVHSFLELSGGE